MKHKRLLQKIAWSFHQTTGLDIEDLYSEACVAYCEAMRSYQPEKGAITTWLWHNIHSQLINYIKQEYKYHQHVALLEHYTTNSRKDEENQALSIKDELSVENHNSFMDTLTPLAQELVKVVMNTPDQFFNSPKESKQKIAALLMDEGWRLKKIWIGIRDIKLALK